MPVISRALSQSFFIKPLYMDQPIESMKSTKGINTRITVKMGCKDTENRRFYKC